MQEPERFLLRGGYVQCARCMRNMTCRTEAPGRHGYAGARGRHEYRCVTTSSRPGACVSNVIEQGALDAAIWDWVVSVLREPDIIARAVAEQTAQAGADPTATRRAAVGRRKHDLAQQRATLATAVATLGEGEAAAPLLALLEQLAPQAREAEADLAALDAERAAWATAQQQLASVLEWCQTWRANLDTLSYNEKRTALEALDVHVVVQPLSEARQAGYRWRATMHPLGGTMRTRTSTDLSGGTSGDNGS